MTINTNGLKKFFSVDENLKRLENAPNIKSPIMDLIYKEDKRELYESPIVKKSDLPTAIKNAPVVVRGDSAFELPSIKTTINGYEPFPIELSKRILASELSDLITNKALENMQDDTTNTNSIYNNQWERMRKTVHATTEALCVQSLKGKISYPIKETSDLYEVDFGTPKTIKSSVNLTSATVGDIIDLCYELVDAVSVNGYGQEVVLLVGKNAFKYIVKLISNMTSNPLGITIVNGAVIFPAFTLVRVGSSYYDYNLKKYVSSIDDNKICAVAVDSPFWLPYCSIDDIEANLRAMPFFTTYQLNKNPSSIDILGKSKPFPVPVVECIAWTEDLL